MIFLDRSTIPSVMDIPSSSRYYTTNDNDVRLASTAAPLSSNGFSYYAYPPWIQPEGNSIIAPSYQQHSASTALPQHEPSHNTFSPHPPCVSPLLLPSPTDSSMDITTLSYLTDLATQYTRVLWLPNCERNESEMKMEHRDLPTFQSFIMHILQATNVEAPVLLMALWFLKRLRAANPLVKAAEGSEYRLFATALLLANKVMDDHRFTNAAWSQVTGLSVEELNIMEREFLQSLDYRLHMSDYSYFLWLQNLQSFSCALNQVRYKPTTLSAASPTDSAVSVSPAAAAVPPLLFPSSPATYSGYMNVDHRIPTYTQNSGYVVPTSTGLNGETGQRYAHFANSHIPVAGVNPLRSMQPLAILRHRRTNMSGYSPSTKAPIPEATHHHHRERRTRTSGPRYARNQPRATTWRNGQLRHADAYVPDEQWRSASLWHPTTVVAERGATVWGL
ncbi:uncharacterized protein SPPG_04851 [Spizellomyces punctatus DAOM BR117]|uniref:Cyclin-like domain-containing protein n=1 Tax=Spizellomyces punctatus (strain DAOM BR117) TaxID=645134 RepID=A0A0L0HHF0_SPIPD|nr:uncharacterized protein SPPG_04851 [Spizellomyces punctatus DAOM BR117]KND00543.1 hypothetical protein SPPG_04851 [Spizellomyces punctatus DAOM BR117]|eukprot:XP_016608582.1 hypothetical protein SPPG_04851 [Spizellomyces punctatus DAOM BR117]